MRFTDFIEQLGFETSAAYVMPVTNDDKNYKCILKDVQTHS